LWWDNKSSSQGGELEKFSITEETISAIYREGVEAVKKLVLQLCEQINHLNERVQALEDRLVKDSHNSHQPPSSDRFKEPLKSLRTQSGKSVGGQAGHPGRTLNLSAAVDEVVVHEAGRECQRCGKSLEGVGVKGYERRQLWDLPPIKMRVVEHQVEIKECPNCGESQRGEFPIEVNSPVQYGEKIRALGVYLHEYQLLPYERASQLLEDVLDCSMSPATIEKAVQECHQGLETTESVIKEEIVRSAVVHVDETGVKVSNKTQWLHVASTPLLTQYRVDEKRGQSAIEAMNILPQLKGSVVHDGWKPYQRYECRHGLCNAHHLRELTFIQEEYQQDWAGKMKGLLVDIKEKVDEEKMKGVVALEEREKSLLLLQYSELLGQGFALNPLKESTSKNRRRGRVKQSPATNLLNRLSVYQGQVLAFMEDFRIPFDNNLAERDLRMMKVRQKISGCFRTWQGAKAFCRIRGYISTMRKQRENILQAIERVFTGNPFIPSLARSPT
jgi:transposase